MLYPVPAWDTLNRWVGRVSNKSNPENANSSEGADWGTYGVAVASRDGTIVTVTPSVETLAGPGVPAGTPGVPFEVMLDEGDIVEVMTKGPGRALTGTRFESNDDHPIALFTGHECAFIPVDVLACDHLEDQVAGLRLWGKRFVAGRVPPRDTMPEASLWQFYASEDGTTIELVASPGIEGLPNSPLSLDAGEMLEAFVTGLPGDPGDFVIEADKPIAVVNYMIGTHNLNDGDGGDPALVQQAPIEQYLPRYVVLVPSGWENDALVLTREFGEEITINGVPVNDDQFISVGDDYEVARVMVDDGVHVLEGASPFSVVVVGWDYADSYAYLGGTGVAVINPNPEG